MQERVEREDTKQVGDSGESEELGDVEVGEDVEEEFGGEVGEGVAFVGFHFDVFVVLIVFFGIWEIKKS